MVVRSTPKVILVACWFQTFQKVSVRKSGSIDGGHELFGSG